MAVNWTNNFNDNQTTDTIQFTVAGNHSSAATVLSGHSVAEFDSDGTPSQNWRVGDEFHIGTATTLYSIVSARFIPGNTNGQFIITPGLVGAKSNGAKATKEGVVSDDDDGYRGNQGSAENHLRLRNMGLI